MCIEISSKTKIKTNTNSTEFMPSNQTLSTLKLMDEREREERVEDMMIKIQHDYKFTGNSP